MWAVSHRLGVSGEGFVAWRLRSVTLTERFWGRRCLEIHAKDIGLNDLCEFA